MKRKELIERLKEKNNKERIIGEYLQSLPKEELERIKNFYYSSIQALRREKNSTKASLVMREQGLLFGFSYSLCHQISSFLVTGRLKTPRQDITKIVLNHNCNSRFGKIMSDKVRIEFDINPTTYFD